MSVAPAIGTAVSREKLLQIARTLPADLQVLSALGDMLQDINSELSEIAGLLRRDVALAARIVRIANSAVFGGGGQIASIEEAVNRVGFSEILKLVGTASAARFSERALDQYGIPAQLLRDNMLYGALAAEALARVTGGEPRVAYTAGLLRPLGLIVLDRAARGTSAGVPRYANPPWSTYSAWEGSVFGVNNCEVTALILGEWRFPLELSAAIREHHATRASASVRPLAWSLNLGNELARRGRCALPGEEDHWELTPEKLEAAGIGADDFDSLQEPVGRAFAAAIEALGKAA